MPLFEMETTTVMDFNLKCIAAIYDCLQLEFNYDTTKQFELDPEHTIDARGLANSRKEIQQHFKPYAQVFDDKHGFLSNLSILDVLFNEGPNTEVYLESQVLNV